MAEPDNIKPKDPDVGEKPKEVKAEAPKPAEKKPVEEEVRIIEEIAQGAEKIEEAKPAEDVLSKEPTVPAVISPDLAILTAKAIVQSINTSQAVVCRLIAKRSDMDFHFLDEDRRALIDAWVPVCRKWGDKIPVEILALLTTVSVVGANVGYAIKSRAPDKK